MGGVTRREFRRCRGKVRGRHRYRKPTRPHEEAAEVYESGGRPTFVAPGPGATPIAVVTIPGGFLTSDARGVEVVVPRATEEPLTAAELLAAAEAGRHGFAVVPRRPIAS